MLLAQHGGITGSQITDDVAAIVELGLDRRWDGVCFSHIVQLGRAIDRNAIVEVFQCCIDSQFLPERANVSGVVHDVAQAKDEPRAGVLPFERIQALAKLTSGAQWLVIDQDKVGRQTHRCGPQDLTAYLPEVLFG